MIIEGMKLWNIFREYSKSFNFVSYIISFILFLRLNINEEYDKKIDANAIKGIFDALIISLFAHTIVSEINR